MQLEDSVRAQPNPDIFPKEVPMSQNIEHFLHRLQSGEEWGGTETLAAVASIENIQINVFFEADTGMRVQEILPDSGEADSVRSINILFRGNHYDAILNFL
jgi:hypothetical protein